MYKYNLLHHYSDIFHNKQQHSPAGLGDIRVKGSSTVTSLKIKTSIISRF